MDLDQDWIDCILIIGYVYYVYGGIDHNHNNCEANVDGANNHNNPKAKVPKPTRKCHWATPTAKPMSIGSNNHK